MSEEDPKDANAWFDKGLALWAMGNYEAALECFKKVTDELDPNFALGWKMRGIVLYKLGKKEEATKCNKMYIELMEKEVNLIHIYNYSFSLFRCKRGIMIKRRIIPNQK